MNEFSLLLDELNPLERMIVELSVVGDIGIRDLSRLIGLSKVNIIARRNEAFEKMKLKMMAQKENYRMFWGRDASLSEIIGSPK
jgi:RNA polymerase sigma-70 factor (ECF subfamily)